MTMHTINEVEKITGVTTSCLRIWQQRYGWPTPDRNVDNGYRMYNPAIVEQIKQVAALIKKGKHIRDLIDDNGCLRSLYPVVEKPFRVNAEAYEILPVPDTARGQETRKEIVRALDREDVAAVAALLHEVPLIHPADRITAILAPVALWMVIGQEEGVRMVVLNQITRDFASMVGAQLEEVMKLAREGAALYRQTAPKKVRVAQEQARIEEEWQLTPPAVIKTPEVPPLRRNVLGRPKVVKAHGKHYNSVVIQLAYGQRLKVS